MTTPTALSPLPPPVWLQTIIGATDPAGAAEQFWAGDPTAPVIGRYHQLGGRTHAEVTFLWREPRTAVDVLVHLNGITDAHRADLTPALLEQVSGTDLWHRTYLLPVDGTWGYRIVARPDLPPDAGHTREGWLAVHRAGEVDPRNPRHQPHALGATSSLLVMPEAFQHPCWGPVPDLEATGQTWQLTEADGQHRTVHYTRIGAAPRRLLVCFDGEQWRALGLQAALRRARIDVELLLIESHSPERRACDLPYPERAAALFAAALEYREQMLGTRVDADRVVVAGQSFGGLAAAACVLLRPDLVREAIVQSGSFWFVHGLEPRRDNPVPGELVGRVRTGELDPGGLVFRIQAGTDEGTMVDQARHFHDACTAGGAKADLTVVTGGHDFAWWKHHLLRVLEETR